MIAKLLHGDKITFLPLLGFCRSFVPLAYPCGVELLSGRFLLQRVGFDIGVDLSGANVCLSVSLAPSATPSAA